MKRKQTKHKRIKRGDSVDSLLIKNEPSWEDVAILTPEQIDARILKATSWYSYSCKNEVYKPWVIDWMQRNKYSKSDVRDAVKVPDNNPLIMSIGKYCRIMNLGGKFVDKVLDNIKSEVDHIIKLGRVVKPKVVKEQVSIQEHIRKKTEGYLCTMNERIDELYLAVCEEEACKFDHEGWLEVEEINHIHWKKMSKILDPFITELKVAYSGKDLELKEAYEYLGKKKIKVMINTLEDFKEILNG